MKFSLPFKTRVALLVLVTLTFSLQLKAQENAVKPLLINSGTFLGETKALRDLPQVSPEAYNLMVAKANKKLLNAKLRDRSYPYAVDALPKGPDAAWQKEMGKNQSKIKAPVRNFEGQTSPYYPPDCNGSVGPNHYFQTVNTTYAIYSKTGTKLAGPTDLNLVFGSVTGATCNDGDPLILYDDQADRWLFVEFSLCGSNEYMLMAVSSSPDPTGTYYAYSFDVADTPDYEKMGVWRDGYYMATNTDPGTDVYVFERDAMIAGAASPKMVAFDNPNRPTSIDGFMVIPPIDNDGAFAPAGSPGLFIAMNDDAIAGGKDQLWIYELSVNWATPASSTFARTQQIDVTAFDSDFGNNWTNIKQKGTSQELDAIPQVIMNVPQYRNFGTYQTIVCCHTVDVDKTDHAGIRWYELRKTTGAWSIRQQGTYAPDAHSRWMGSIMLNGTGKIGLGYSISSSTEYPGIRYSGQSANAYAAANSTLDVAEEIIHSGSYSQTNAERWGDYSLLSVDPTDNETFWYTSQYVGSGDARKSKIASFKVLANPTVVTQAASAITSTSATLNGTVNPNGLATDYYFNWGTSTSYGNVTSTTSAGSGSADIAVNAGISGLTPGTTYHFSLVAINSDGTTNGSDLTFIPGQAEVTTSAVTGITATTAASGGNVTAGGSGILSRGVCWSTTANPTTSDALTVNGAGIGTFTSTLTGLEPGTLYHVRAYATNAAGAAYGSDEIFTTESLAIPVAIPASGIGSSAFTARWNAVEGATTYNLDVSAYPTFEIAGGTSTLTEGFGGGIIAPEGWAYTGIGGTYTSTGNYGAASPSLKLDATNDAVVTTTVNSAATQLSFWVKGQGTDAASALEVAGYNGSSWISVENISPLPTTGTTKIYSSTSSPALPAGMSKFRFTYNKSGGNLALDDIKITYGGSVPSMITGYNNLSVSAVSHSVSGLAASTPYYYRVRAANGSITTASSNAITVTTAAGTTPELTVNPATLSGFTYVNGNGPSASQSYTLNGSMLAGAPGIITVSGSTNYEVSTDNSTFSGSVTIDYTTATLASTPIYVRLKAGLGIGNYNSELITNAGDGAPTMHVSCNGSVTSTAIPMVTAGTLAAFEDQTVNTVSAEKSYTVSATGLTSDIILSPPAGFEISLNPGTGFVTNPGTLTVTQSGGVVSPTLIYVRFVPLSVQVYSGSILHTSTGAETQNVAVSGTAIGSTAPMVVISQVYGGGGNTGAIYTNDFIELFNRGATSVNLNGWSVQYASATGTTWTNSTPLPNVTLPPGQYYLIKEGSGGTVGTALPTPDVSGTISMSGTNGKVALVNNTNALTGACPTGTNIIDFVGYGTTANCFEGSASTPSTSNTTAAIRASDGCADTDQNSADFAIGTPAPRNSASTLNVCVPATPILVVMPVSLSGFTYVEGHGPSVSQSYTLSGSDLTGAPGTITVTGSTNYAVSADNVTFSGSVNIPYTSSTLEPTLIYVILKGELTEGLYNSEVIINAGGGTTTINVTASGTVTPFNTGIKPAESPLAAAYSFNKTVFVNMKDNSKGDIFIYNAEGKLIRSIPAVQGLNRIELDASGIYFVKVLTTRTNLVKKVWIR